MTEVTVNGTAGASAVGEGNQTGTVPAANGSNPQASGVNVGGEQSGSATQPQGGKPPKPVEEQSANDERLKKIIQSQVDRAMAEERKKSARLQEQIKNLQKEKLSDEELKKLEMEEQEKALADKEKALSEKENRFYAIKAIKTAGLDDGSDNALALVDFVVGDDEEAINERVKAFKSLVDSFVAAQVNKTFKEQGRNPAGTGAGAAKPADNNPAVLLGKVRAEQMKKSQDIINYYTGGKK